KESIGVGTRLADCRKALAKAQATENVGNGTE
ncbi:terminase, partial [Pseudomonas syringae]|nr:terminase [Pseudomonas syringae]